MGVEIEAQNKSEVMQLKARELQQESVEKLNDIIPVVNDIENVDFQKIANDTSNIQDIVSQNLEDQVDLDKMYDAVITISKGITEIKKSNTRLSNAVKETQAKLDETQSLLENIQENMGESNE
ncbi:hypothetical protein [uncultured Methanobrevibacter sp.]|uniref:hypothetical protein n=1 Tax=uncultured Methanobrevibacter sp. TaxID=253161 RepID=UPI0025E076B7|nr:hypothetical protein [uncultured Methanobrevibacter sp.]